MIDENECDMMKLYEIKNFYGNYTHSLTWDSGCCVVETKTSNLIKNRSLRFKNWIK